VRHFQKIAEGIDVIPLLNALAGSDLWNENTLRTTHPLSPHQQTDDIWCLFNAIPDDPEAVIDDCEVIPYRAWTDIPALRPLVLNLMRAVDGMRLGRVLITRLASGNTIPEHTDQGAPATYYKRYHLALKSEPGALNISGGEIVTYKMGEFWYFDNTVPHSIVNNSADDRIVLVVDVRPC
jgi:glycerol-3-phosphate dehydrogenase